MYIISILFNIVLYNIALYNIYIYIIVIIYCEALQTSTVNLVFKLPSHFLLEKNGNFSPNLAALADGLISRTIT